MTNNIIVNGATSQLMMGPTLNHYGHSITTNIMVWRSSTGSVFRINALSTLYPFDGNMLVEMNRNLFWCTGACNPATIMHGNLTKIQSPPPQSMFPMGGGGLAEWQAITGLDRDSVVADPEFVNAEAGDFSLRADSPALAMGFQQIPRLLPPSDVGAPSIGRSDRP